MKDRQNLRCSYLRACGFALRGPSSHKSCYTQSRPWHRHPLTQDPRMPGPRRLPPTPPNHPAARFIEYNSVLWPDRLLHCHGACEGRLQRPHPRARWGSRPKTTRTAPARRHPSFHPKHSAGIGNKVRRGSKDKDPTPNALTVAIDGPHLPLADNCFNRQRFPHPPPVLDPLHP